MHKEWFASQTDLYLAPTVEVKDNLVGFGALPENVLVTGVPVRQQFLNKKVISDISENHLVPTKCSESEKQVLIMGGGLGIMPELNDILCTLHEMPGVKTTVITGKNQKLYETWKGCYDDIEVHGYVDQIGEFMRKADLVITKAGGITLFEILHSQVPMFIIRPFLEQEIVNARYAQKKGFARVVWDKKEDFAVELRKLLEDSQELEKMRICMTGAQKEIMDTELSEAVGEISVRGWESVSDYSFFKSDWMPILSLTGQRLLS